ncbi:hypothetical protein F0562_004444 [Nyssa sinensis]|uniref:Uncharacterized protein n=1 Tax=Nyssa sinensis TaxID=561372 RepID=A0A5J5BY44_9ASTE|nr:hypothetical protein F0562_004444 [Nyssa sinensis]
MSSKSERKRLWWAANTIKHHISHVLMLLMKGRVRVFHGWPFGRDEEVREVGPVEAFGIDGGRWFVTGERMWRLMVPMEERGRSVCCLCEMGVLSDGGLEIELAFVVKSIAKKDTLRGSVLQFVPVIGPETWPVTFCASGANCVPGLPRNFTLHDLWPANSKGVTIRHCHSNTSRLNSTVSLSTLSLLHENPFGILISYVFICTV